MRKLAGVFVLVAAAIAQSDKSTPENSVKSFLKERYTFEGAPIFTKISEDADKVEDPYVTEEYRKKKKETAEKNKQYFSEHGDFKTESAEGTKNADGTVTVLTKDSYKMKDKRETRTLKFVMKQFGSDWLIMESYTECYACKGTGSCGSCNGTGKFGDSECFNCKGSKGCQVCKGEKWKKEDYDKMEAEFVIADAGYKPLNDLSSASRAAETYSHVMLQQAVGSSDYLMKLFDDMNKLFVTYFSPEISKTVSGLISKSKEKGKENFKNFKPAVISVKEVDATTANAEVAAPAAVLMRGNKKSQKILLKKVGEKWLVDKVLQDCWSCEGSGKCRPCTGSGKSGDEKCYACSGNGVCSNCKGSGFMEN